MSSFEPKWSLAHKFCVDFNATASELASQLNALRSSSGVPPATIQAVASDLSRLTKSLSDTTGSLPSYDQRQCELQLKALEKSVEELRATSASTPKFSFKRKGTKPKPVTEHTLSTAFTLTEFAKSLAGFSHRYLTILDLHFADSLAEVSISDLDNCVVNLLPSNEDRTKTTALYVRRVSRSVVLLPQITGSVILHDLLDCVIVVGCHQFRMHDSTVVDVYLESGSDPIIEHCSGVRFAAYPSSLAREPLQDKEHFVVKDFSHILPTLSPNWSFLPEGRWERSWPVSPLQNQALLVELKRMLPANSQPTENESQA